MNPWTKVPRKAPYVLEADRPYLDAFNAICRDPAKEINFNHPPEPRLGPIDAPVVFLQSNPSFAEQEHDGPADHEELSESLNALENEYRAHKGAGATGGWWASRLKELRSSVGDDCLARNLLSVEFFPYRSRKFGHGEIRLPSQPYTFSLVRAAIERDAVIVVARNWALWCAAVPELLDRDGHTVFKTKSARSTYYSRGNIERDGFDRIVDAIVRT